MKKNIIFSSFVLFAMLLVGCSNPNLSTSASSSSSTLESDPTSENSSTTQDNSSSVESSNQTSSEIETSSSSESSSSSSEEELNDNEVIFNSESSGAIEISIGQLLAIPKSNVDGTLYRVTGVMQYVQNDYLGNFDLTDDTGSITVWGTSKNKSSISGSGTHHLFNNDKSFSEMDLHGGDIVTMEVVHLIYSKNNRYLIPEIQGYVTKAVKTNSWNIEPLNYQEKDPYSGSYYSEIGEEKGNALGTKLHNLMIKTHTSNISYKSLEDHFKHCDSINGKTVDFYTEKPISGNGSLNREHVWPQSLSNNTWGESGGGSDLHHLRACISSINSTRGNRRFAPTFNHEHLKSYSHVRGGKNYYTADHTTVGVWEPADCIKGDVARIIAYTFVHYTTSYGGETNAFTNMLYLNDVIGVGRYETHDLLRRWNALDPVDDYEIRRNEYVYSKQHNRNPFIDHPSYMDSLFA